MSELIQDLKQSFRMIRNRPGFAAAIILSIALGVGANSAIFSVANILLIRPLPFPEGDELIRVQSSFHEPGKGPQHLHLSEFNVAAIREQSTQLEGVSAWLYGTYNLIGGDEPVRVFGALTTANAVDVMGVEPMLGRSILPDEEMPSASAPVAVISYKLWQNQFGSDPDVVGRSVHLNDEPHTVVGVMPAGYHYPYKSDVWVPLGLDPTRRLRVEHILHVVARLKPGVSLKEAGEELDLIATRLAQDRPDTHAHWGFTIEPLREDMNRDMRSTEMVFMLLAGSGFLLLIACANVATMLLGRAIEKRNEIAIHSALGISRARLVRQLIVQGLVLALLSGALGFLLAYWMFPLIAMNPIEDLTVMYRDLEIDYRVLIFTLITSVAVGILFSLIPALKMSRPNLQSLLTEGNRTTPSRSGRRLLRWLVAGEIAVTVMLLVASGLMFKSLRSLYRIDPGFEAENLLVLNFTPSEGTYPGPVEQIAYITRLVEHVNTVPGVSAAAVNSLFALRRGQYLARAQPEGWPANDPDSFMMTNHRVVTPGLVEALGLRLLQGRDFTEQDHDESEYVVIVSETFAQHAWPGENALDRRVRMVADGVEIPWMRVIGVVGDVTDNGDEVNTWYVSYQQYIMTAEFMDLLVRTEGDPMALLPTIRKAIWSIDENQAVANVMPADQILTGRLWQEQSNAFIFAMFAVLGLTLAVVGIFGIQSYSVLQQIHEIGIRMIFGARPKQVRMEIIRQGMAMSAVGLVIGVVGALMLTRFLGSMLHDVSPTDPVTFILISALALIFSLVANYLPARRATRVDPVEIIRY